MREEEKEIFQQTKNFFLQIKIQYALKKIIPFLGKIMKLFAAKLIYLAEKF